MYVDCHISQLKVKKVQSSRKLKAKKISTRTEMKQTSDKKEMVFSFCILYFNFYSMSNPQLF